MDKRSKLMSPAPKEIIMVEDDKGEAEEAIEEDVEAEIPGDSMSVELMKTVQMKF